jgi:hypothetical protein
MKLLLSAAINFPSYCYFGYMVSGRCHLSALWRRKDMEGLYSQNLRNAHALWAGMAVCIMYGPFTGQERLHRALCAGYIHNPLSDSLSGTNFLGIGHLYRLFLSRDTNAQLADVVGQ